LSDDDLIRSRRGSGTTIISLNKKTNYVQTVASIDELIEYATETRYEVDKSELIISDKALALKLNCDRGEKWVRIVGYRYAPDDQIPICWTEVYIRPEYSGVIRMLARRKGPIYSWIEDMYGERIVEVQQTLQARRVPEAIAPKLQVGSDSMVVEVCRIYRVATGIVAEIAFNLHPADRFRYSMTLRRGKSQA
jgi:DNA-binding GntR family transcriptional regulator